MENISESTETSITIGIIMYQSRLSIADIKIWKIFAIIFSLTPCRNSGTCVHFSCYCCLWTPWEHSQTMFSGQDHGSTFLNQKNQSCFLGLQRNCTLEEKIIGCHIDDKPTDSIRISLQYKHFRNQIKNNVLID